MWRVEFDRDTAFVAGPKAEARRRLAVCGDASPIWVRRRDAWATSRSVAGRLLDQLEGRDVFVSVEDSAQPELDLSRAGAANYNLTPETLW